MLCRKEALKITRDHLKIYRKRFIPPECILLKDDSIVSCNEDTIITKWNTLKPKAVFQYGASCYFLKKGYKVSKYYQADGTLVYWYCDIVDYEYDEKKHALTVTDLLADVIIYPDGRLKVVDLDELAEALDRKIMTEEQISRSLRVVNDLLSMVYRDKFDQLQAPLELLGL